MIFIIRGACKDPESILDCHRRLYNQTVTKKDALGRSCWDKVSAVSCWGRCDSREIPDWQFPYKKSFHPVCIHDERELFKMTLKNCEEGTEPGTEIFEYYEAVSCKCSACKSSEASCEGLRLSDSNFHPQLL
ncbi:hypothetical protein V9T40_012092 [Parthenolecanium corni]|uniref:Glycoprotein hormone subunit beta domain-containing protein n=1 Tax=Parthenolecanium corni TaxID=536013 RepID=A0AAN9XYS1_9HEMI